MTADIFRSSFSQRSPSDSPDIFADAPARADSDGELTDGEFTDKIADVLLNNDGELVMDPEGVIHLGNTIDGPGNNTVISDGAFAGGDTDGELIDKIAEAMLDDDDEIFMDPDGVIRLGDTVSGPGNYTKISDGAFAASPPRNQDRQDQWYAKNPALFRAEVANMRKRHPKAKYGFMPQSGDMYWVIELQIIQGIEPWQFMLRYMKDHPHNRDFGGSIRVILLKHPTLEQIRERATAHGYAGVPHLLSGSNSDGSKYTYLCTRTRDDVSDGKEKIASAVQVASWAGDWALHFEIGMKDKRVWNNWCDEPAFRHLMVP